MTEQSFQDDMDHLEDTDTLSWSVVPAVQYPWRALTAAVVIALTGIFLSLYAGGPIIGVAGVVILLVVLNSFYIPSAYRLGPRGVEVRRLFLTKRRPWSDFKCFYCDRFGMMLSTKTRPSRLDPWRGCSLWFPDDEKAARQGRPDRRRIREFVSRHVPPYRPPVDHRELLG